MKKIGIDARLYFQTGVGVYIRNLIYYLSITKTDDFIFTLYVRSQDLNKIKVNNKKFILVPVSAPWHSFKEQTSFLKKILMDNLDLMHFTYFGYPIFYNKPFIATVHDLTPLLHKTGSASTLSPLLYKIKHFILKIVLFSQINNSLKIIAPTHAVKNQIENFYGKKYSSKIIVTHEGVSFELTNNMLSSKKFKLPDKYFLYVGNFYPHKNVETLIEAFKKIKHKDISLILVGPKNIFSKKLKNHISPENKKIHFLHDLDDSNMPEVYRNAIALINPSFSEGFGLPIVESSFFKTPVIASDIAVFKEILGENGNYFNPQDEARLAQLMNDYQNLIISKINSSFSFEKMTSETLKIYSDILL